MTDADPPTPEENPPMTTEDEQHEQIAHYRKIANDHGYCGGIVYSHRGDVEGPCARDVGHEGRCAP